MEQLEVQETVDNKYYQRGEYLLWGVESERNGIIIAKVYSPTQLAAMVITLNNANKFK